MSDHEASPRKRGVPLACDMSALTPEQRERQRELGRWLRDEAEVRELDGGYEFAHPAGSRALADMAEFVANERVCCPFFDFGITVEAGGGPARLRITGREGAKEILGSEMGLAARGAVHPPGGATIGGV